MKNDSKTIYCPHLQEQYNKHQMVWIKDMGISIALTEEVYFIACNECTDMIVIQSLMKAAQKFG